MEGKCHLCNQYKNLSFEHVPPKSAFNNKRVLYYTGDDFLKHIGADNLPWDFSGLKPTQSQRGMGGYTLCEECNSQTGHWYGSSFAQFIAQSYKTIYDLGEFGTLNSKKNIMFKFKNIYPQRVVKQIVCMFFSINNENLCIANKYLANIILNPRSSAYEDNKYALKPYVNTGKLIRNTGITASLNINTGNIKVVSELSALPFGFILKFNPKSKETLNIMDWIGKYQYDDCVDLELTVPVYQANTAYPEDFRTKEEIIKQRDGQ